MKLSNDSLAIVMLCSRLGLSPYEDIKPYTLRDWNTFAKKLVDQNFRPGDLIGLSAFDIHNNWLPGPAVVGINIAGIKNWE